MSPPFHPLASCRHQQVHTHTHSRSHGSIPFECAYPVLVGHNCECVHTNSGTNAPPPTHTRSPRCKRRQPGVRLSALDTAHTHIDGHSASTMRVLVYCVLRHVRCGMCMGAGASADRHSREYPPTHVFTKQVSTTINAAFCGVYLCALDRHPFKSDELQSSGQSMFGISHLFRW